MIQRMLRLAIALPAAAACIAITTRSPLLLEAEGPTSTGAFNALGLGSFLAVSILLLGKAIHAILHRFLDSTRMEYWVAGADLAAGFFGQEAARFVGNDQDPVVKGAISLPREEARDFLWVDTLPDLDVVKQASK